MKKDWEPKEYIRSMGRRVMCPRCGSEADYVEIGRHPNTWNNVTYSPSFVTACCRVRPSPEDAEERWDEEAATAQSEGDRDSRVESSQEGEESKAPEVDQQWCRGCGAFYSYLWYAPNELWNAVNEAGHPVSHLCIPCFNRQAGSIGHDLIFAALELGAPPLNEDAEKAVWRVLFAEGAEDETQLARWNPEKRDFDLWGGYDTRENLQPTADHLNALQQQLADAERQQQEMRNEVAEILAAKNLAWVEKLETDQQLEDVRQERDRYRGLLEEALTELGPCELTQYQGWCLPHNSRVPCYVGDIRERAALTPPQEATRDE